MDSDFNMTDLNWREEDNDSFSAFEFATEKYIEETPGREDFDMSVGKYFSNFDDREGNLDVYELFRFYNPFFFSSKLEACFVRWSKRMTLCAGTCQYDGPGTCTITLSQSLLQFRTNDEVKETLLHEMIHAYLFITNPRGGGSRDGHGPNFIALMQHINSVTGLNITVYHSFHDEVNHFKKHVWRCNGICKEKPPFYGFVRRAMNRPPGSKDWWFERHGNECGGTYVKTDGPEFSEEAKKKVEEKEQNLKKRKTADKEKSDKHLISGLKSSDRNDNSFSLDSEREKGKRLRLNDSQIAINRDSKEEKCDIQTIESFIYKKERSNENSQASFRSQSKASKPETDIRDFFPTKKPLEINFEPKMKLEWEIPSKKDQSVKKDSRIQSKKDAKDENFLKLEAASLRGTLMSLRISYGSAENDFWRLILINGDFSLGQFVNILFCMLYQRNERDDDIAMFYQNDIIVNKRMKLIEVLDQTKKKQMTIILNRLPFKITLTKNLALEVMVKNRKYSSLKDTPVCLAGFSSELCRKEIKEETVYSQYGINQLLSTCNISY